jgi:hypothetical protein
MRKMTKFRIQLNFTPKSYYLMHNVVHSHHLQDTKGVSPPPHPNVALEIFQKG